MIKSRKLGELAGNGRAVQVDPIKPTLKAPGSMLLKLRYVGPVLNFAFKVNLRRYTTASPPSTAPSSRARRSTCKSKSSQAEEGN